MKKVCHLTSVHPDNDGRIFRKECASLVELGYDVTLIAAGAEDHVDLGVQVIGVIKDAGRLKRMKYTTARVYRKAVEVDADIYHFHDPELLPVGLKLKKSGKKVIYDAHEDVPRQILDKFWIPKPLRILISRRFEKYENKIAAQLDGVITSTSHIRDRFLKVNKNSLDINNFPILDENKGLPSWESRKNQVVYVGGLFNVRGITELVTLAENCKYPIILAGKFENSEFEEKLKQLPGWKNVEYRGYLSRNETDQLLLESKIGMVTLHKTPAHLDSLPTKMFEYLLAGLPVIASDFPLWKSIIVENHCGLCVDPKNVKAIQEAIDKLMGNQQLAEELGLNGRKVVLQKFTWKQEKIKLGEYYSNL